MLSDVITPPQALVERALALVSTQKELGERLQMSTARVSRVVNGARLSVPNCLRLADLLNESPSVVLRAYRYPAEAEILDRAYRASGRVPRGLAEILEALQRLEPDDARLFGKVIKRFALVSQTAAATTRDTNRS
jgi:hypothetical protein